MSDTTKLKNIAKRAGYRPQAFFFVQRGLEFAVNREHGEVKDKSELNSYQLQMRHIDGKTLCYGLRDYALEQYGMMAKATLKYWNINSCQDFGNIVFSMVRNKIISRTPEDSIDDFNDVFNFDDAFSYQAHLILQAS